MNFRMRWIPLLLGLGLLAPALPGLAHHGWSEYDSGKALRVSGQIAGIRFDNPHVVIDLKEGERTWLVVLAPPSRMANRGLPQESLRVGMAVRVEAYLNRKTPTELRAERIVVGGRTTELR